MTNDPDRDPLEALTAELRRLCIGVDGLQRSADRIVARLGVERDDDSPAIESAWLNYVDRRLNRPSGPAAIGSALAIAKEAVTHLEFAQADMRLCAARLELILNSRDLRADLVERLAEFNRRQRREADD
jgi:hypothetical protein